MTRLLPPPLLPHCSGKEQYPSKAAALEAKTRRLRRAKAFRHPHKDKKRNVSGLEAYHCANCHNWHLGHRDNGTLPR